MSDHRYKPLPWTKLTRGVPCYLSKVLAQTKVEAGSPALEVLTDYRRQPALTIAPGASLEEANRMMACAHAPFLLVADEQAQLLGIVTEAGTKGSRPLAAAHQLGLRPTELVVANVMIDKHDDAEVMHLRDVEHARVGNILSTLKELGTPFCLVVDHDAADNHVLCGVFSLHQIERQMGIEPQPEEIAQTFSQVVSSLGH